MTRAAFKLSSDRKTAQVLKYEANARRFKPLARNAFGLPAGRDGSCPGATSCEDYCYTANAPWPSVRKLLQHNLDVLDACQTHEERVDLFDRMIAAGKAEHYLRSDEPYIFRFFWSGDMHQLEVVEAIIVAVQRHADVSFWGYTRSITDTSWWPALRELAAQPNMQLFLSTDDENIEWVGKFLAEDEDGVVRVAYTARDLLAATDMRQKLGRDRRSLPCPEVSGSMPLVVDNDGNPKGACAQCTHCWRDTNVDVTFEIR